MRTLNALLLLLSLPVSAVGAQAPAPRPVLEVIRTSHRTRQWTRIYHGAQGWYCATDVNPMFPLPGAPAVLALFHSSPSEKPSACRAPFRAYLRQDGKTRTWTGCSEEENAARFLHALGEACGRF